MKEKLIPSLATVAKYARVSPITVSYALRNNPKISPATRERVRRAARRLGYVPDPEIGRLMQLLRVRRQSARVQANLAQLTFASADTEVPQPYTRELRQGVVERAKELGYAVDSIRINPRSLGPERLTTMLRTRGIRGIVIPPLPELVDCISLLDWSHFSVIAASNAATNLPVNRVVPHYVHNINLILRRLTGKGVRRIGFVYADGLDERTDGVYHAALALAHQRGQIDHVPTFHFSGPVAMTTWWRRHKPEVLLINDGDAAVNRARQELGPLFPGLNRVILLNRLAADASAGVDQQPQLIGTVAVELLSAQLQHGEFGLPEHPRVVMIPGTWHEEQ